jgi:hypothetical protein
LPHDKYCAATLLQAFRNYTAFQSWYDNVNDKQGLGPAQNQRTIQHNSTPDFVDPEAEGTSLKHQKEVAK